MRGFLSDIGAVAALNGAGYRSMNPGNGIAVKTVDGSSFASARSGNWIPGHVPGLRRFPSGGEMAVHPLPAAEDVEFQKFPPANMQLKGVLLRPPENTAQSEAASSSQDAPRE